MPHWVTRGIPIPFELINLAARSGCEYNEFTTLGISLDTEHWPAALAVHFVRKQAVSIHTSCGQLGANSAHSEITA